MLGLLTFTARNLVCSLAIALAFAAVASRRDGKLSLLEELLAKAQNLLGNGSSERGFQRFQKRQERDYIESILASSFSHSSDKSSIPKPPKSDPESDYR